MRHRVGAYARRARCTPAFTLNTTTPNGELERKGRAARRSPVGSRPAICAWPRPHPIPSPEPRGDEGGAGLATRPDAIIGCTDMAAQNLVQSRLQGRPSMKSPNRRALAAQSHALTTVTHSSLEAECQPLLAVMDEMLPVRVRIRSKAPLSLAAGTASQTRNRTRARSDMRLPFLPSDATASA